MTRAFGLSVLMIPFAHASTEVITNFRLRTCAEESVPRTCVGIDADESRRGPLDRAYVFRTGRVRVTKAGEADRVFRVSAGYFDPDSAYLVMHGHPGGLVNLRTGRIVVIDDPINSN